MVLNLYFEMMILLFDWLEDICWDGKLVFDINDFVI